MVRSGELTHWNSLLTLCLKNLTGTLRQLLFRCYESETVWSFLVRGLDDGTYPEQFYRYSSGLSQDEVQKRYGMMHCMTNQMTGQKWWNNEYQLRPFAPIMSGQKTWSKIQILNDESCYLWEFVTKTERQ